MSPFEPLPILSANNDSPRPSEAQLWFRSIVLPLIFLMMFIALTGKAAIATNYYMSPTGKDTGPGLTQGAPWRTFAYAIPRLNPGDTLTLLNGTYQLGTGTGFPNINCTTTAKNGTVGKPITIQALNERQAFIKGDGTVSNPFTMTGCAYWSVIGLHVEDGDFPSQQGGEAVMDFVHGNNHLVVRRNILAHNNRYANAMSMAFNYDNTFNLIEENEFYYYHRQGLSLYGGSNNNEVRRNYSNSRSYPDLPGCTPGQVPGKPRCSGNPDTGDSGIIDYGASSNTFENNISENNLYGFDTQTITGAVSSINNTWLGNITISDIDGLRAAPHSSAEVATGLLYSNNVVVSPHSVGAYMRQTQSTITHGSFFLTSGTANGGILADAQGVNGSFHISVDNTQVVGGVAVTGFQVFAGQGTWSGTSDHVNSFGNKGNFSMGGLPLTNPSTINPGFGACYLWVPARSPLKGAGKDGGDIGANIVYQYSGGRLTGTPLWTSNGPAFAGATVAGLNDVAGNSLFDIANRLNINKNGCSLPTDQASVPAAPTGLTATVQ